MNHTVHTTDMEHRLATGHYTVTRLNNLGSANRQRYFQDYYHETECLILVISQYCRVHWGLGAKQLYTPLSRVADWAKHIPHWPSVTVENVVELLPACSFSWVTYRIWHTAPRHIQLGSPLQDSLNTTYYVTFPHEKFGFNSHVLVSSCVISVKRL